MNEIIIEGRRFNIAYGRANDHTGKRRMWMIKNLDNVSYQLSIEDDVLLHKASMEECLLAIAHLDQPK